MASWWTNGNLISEAYFGTDDRPARNKDGCVATRNTFDDRGRKARSLCLDLRDVVVLSRQGCVETTFSYHLDGRVDKKLCVKPNGRSTPLPLE